MGNDPSPKQRAHSIVCLIRGSIAALTDSCFSASSSSARPLPSPSPSPRRSLLLPPLLLRATLHRTTLLLVFGRTRTAVTHNHRGRRKQRWRRQSPFRSATVPPHVRLTIRRILITRQHLPLFFHVILRPNVGNWRSSRQKHLVHRSGERTLNAVSIATTHMEKGHEKRKNEQSDSPGEALHNIIIVVKALLPLLSCVWCSNE